MNQKTGNEHFCFDNMPAGYNMLNDFWKWQASDLLNNTLRGALAEFIVAKALGIETKKPRIDWEPYDLLFNDKLRIEVKSTAYLQSWEQKRDSVLHFSISPRRAWYTKTGYEEEPRRHSDIYIFCVFTEKKRDRANPLNLDQWEFYPVLTTELDNQFPMKQSTGIASILRLCPEAYNYASLRDAVLWLMSSRADNKAVERIEAHNALKRANNNG